jgi:hypothetical protein
MQFLVSGTNTITGPAGSSYGGVCMGVNPGSVFNNQCNIAVVPGVVSVSAPLAVTFGQSSTFSIGFAAFEHIVDYLDPNVSFTADFAHTVTLAGFVVADGSGNALSSFNVTSGSGTTYPSTTLPEPSTFVLLGAAISLGVVSRRLRSGISYRVR